MKMRRSDREILDDNRIDEIIRGCHCCRLGFADEGECYIVPMSFGFERQDGARIFYFHSAREGRKIDLARKLGQVGFELDRGAHLRLGTHACNATTSFESVIGTGSIVIVEDAAEKLHALSAIMAQASGRSDWEFPEGAEKMVTVLKLTVAELKCKVHE